MKDMKASRPSFILFIWLVVMWVILWGEISWGNILGGVTIALLIAIIVPMPRLPIGELNFNFNALLRLFASWSIDFIVASFQVAWLAVRRADPPPSAVIHVPMRTREDLTLATAMALINLQPGGIIIDIDKETHLLTMHILDASSTSKIDKTIAQLTRFERRIVRAFENRDVEYDQEAVQ